MSRTQETVNAIEAMVLESEQRLNSLDVTSPLCYSVPSEKSRRRAELDAELAATASEAELVGEALARLSYAHELVKNRRKSVMKARADDAALPPEVLRKIFFALVNSSFSSQEEVDGGSARIISHVSMRWRSIALEQSALWRRVDFAHYDEGEMALRLARAENQPLDLTVEMTEIDGETAVEMIHTYALRWQVIHVNGRRTSRSNIRDFIRGLELGRCTSLQSFSVVFPNEASMHPNFRLYQDSYYQNPSWVPPIRSLSTAHVRFEDIHDAVRQLTELMIEDAAYSTATWTAILQNLECIEHLSLIRENIQPSSQRDEVGKQAKIVLTALRALEVVECPRQTLLFVFGAELQVPRLRSLKLKFSTKFKDRAEREELMGAMMKFCFDYPEVILEGEIEHVATCLKAMDGATSYKRLEILQVLPDRAYVKYTDLEYYFKLRQVEAVIEAFFKKHYDNEAVDHKCDPDLRLKLNVSKDLKLGPSGAACRFQEDHDRNIGLP